MASPQWETDAVERSLRTGRARSAATARRLVDAARALAAAHGSTFTVQDVADRSGLSLKSLYKFFPSKDDLLLAVFEEDNRLGAAILAEAVEAEHDPAERIRAYLRGLFELATTNTQPAYTVSALREYLRLAQHRAADVERVLAPFLDLLTTELTAAQAAGAVRARDARQDATSLFLLAVAHLSPLLLTGSGGAASAADSLWRFCFEGLHPPGACPPGRRDQ